MRDNERARDVQELAGIAPTRGPIEGEEPAPEQEPQALLGVVSEQEIPAGESERGDNLPDEEG